MEPHVATLHYEWYYTLTLLVNKKKKDAGLQDKKKYGNNKFSVNEIRDVLTLFRHKDICDRTSENVPVWVFYFF